MGKEPDRVTVDWAKQKTKQEVLIDQRMFLWFDDTLDKLAEWLGLRHGMQAQDVGCGLGYVGRAFWRHFGSNGSYIGLDASERLLRDASVISREWAFEGTAAFIRGDAGALPFPDNTFDWTACQTLLMHAADPDAFLAEMVRVTRPGGIVMCNEPDNITAIRACGYKSFREETIEDELLRIRVHHHWAAGRKKLGYGDYGIGCRVPSMMLRRGLEDIDIRANDMPAFIQPPYETPLMKFRMEQVGESIRQQEKLGEKGLRMDRQFRSFYFAGEGSIGVWRRFLAMVRRNGAKQLEAMKRQFEEGTLETCGGACSFYSIKGRKPT